MRIRRFGGSSRQYVDPLISISWILLNVLQIGNACGSIGLLHSLLNLPRDASSPYALPRDSLLSKFYNDTKDMTGLERAKALDEATFFEEAHKRVAESGQSSVPRTAEELDDVDLHFISFVEGTAADG
jgi:ubiquitin carboxyl-terminal hydrolase L3